MDFLWTELLVRMRLARNNVAMTVLPNATYATLARSLAAAERTTVDTLLECSRDDKVGNVFETYAGTLLHSGDHLHLRTLLFLCACADWNAGGQIAATRDSPQAPRIRLDPWDDLRRAGRTQVDGLLRAHGRQPPQYQEAPAGDTGTGAVGPPPPQQAQGPARDGQGRGGPQPPQAGPARAAPDAPGQPPPNLRDERLQEWQRFVRDLPRWEHIISAEFADDSIELYRLRATHRERLRQQYLADAPEDRHTIEAQFARHRSFRDLRRAHEARVSRLEALRARAQEEEARRVAAPQAAQATGAPPQQQQPPPPPAGPPPAEATHPGNQPLILYPNPATTQEDMQLGAVASRIAGVFGADAGALIRATEAIKTAATLFGRAPALRALNSGAPVAAELAAGVDQGAQPQRAPPRLALGGHGGGRSPLQGSSIPELVEGLISELVTEPLIRAPPPSLRVSPRASQPQLRWRPRQPQAPRSRPQLRKERARKRWAKHGDEAWQHGSPWHRPR